MRVRKQNQAFLSEIVEVSAKVRENPRAYFESLTLKQRKLLNGILNYYYRKGKAYMRQDTLAKFAGYKSRQHVNMLLGKFIEDGIIASNYRHMTSCEYKVAPFFDDFKIRALLRPLLSAFVVFPIHLLDAFLGLRTQNVSNYIYIIDRSNQFDQKVINSARARTRGGTVSTDLKKNGASRMIADYVNDIDSIELSIADKIALSRYSKQAVEYSLMQLKKKDGVSNPVAYMVVCCKSFQEKKATGKQTKSTQTRPQRAPEPPRETRDAAFWKKDSDNMAHIDIVSMAAHLQKAEGILGKSWTGIYMDKYRAALAQHDQSTCHLCLDHGPDYRKSLESHKASGDHKPPLEGPTSPAFSVNQTPREKMAELATRALERQKSENMPNLTMERRAVGAPSPMTHSLSARTPEIQSTINLDEPEPSGGYDESEYEEIF